MKRILKSYLRVVWTATDPNENIGMGNMPVPSRLQNTPNNVTVKNRCNENDWELEKIPGCEPMACGT